MCNSKIVLFTSDHCKSNITAEENGKTFDKGYAARCDVKLLIARIKRWPFILFVIKLASCRIMIIGLNWKRKWVWYNFTQLGSWFVNGPVWRHWKYITLNGENKLFWTSFKRKWWKLNFISLVFDFSVWAVYTYGFIFCMNICVWSKIPITLDIKSSIFDDKAFLFKKFIVKDT